MDGFKGSYEGTRFSNWWEMGNTSKIKVDKIPRTNCRGKLRMVHFKKGLHLRVGGKELKKGSWRADF